MSEEKSYKMNENIGSRVRHYLVGYFLIILTIIWGNKIYEIIIREVTDKKEQIELTGSIVETISIIIPGIVVFLLNLGRDIDVHNFIDKKVFKVRSRTNKIICEGMIEAAKKVQAPSANEMEGNEEKVSNLFYHFVNGQEVLRSRAFTYWEQYFVNIYNITFALISFIISIVLLVIKQKIDYMLFAPIFFLLIIILVGINTRSLVVNKLYKIPLQQIEEICTSNINEFKAQIESRFGRSIILSEGYNGRL